MTLTDPKLWSRSVAVAALALAAGPALADALIVRSTGPSAAAYPPGRKLPDTARLSLKARDVVVLLDARGTRTLTGPGDYLANAKVEQKGPSVLAALTNERSAPRVRAGATRTPEGELKERSDIWSVDVTKPGAVCIIDPATVILWRPKAEKAANGRIAAVGGGTSIALDWAPSQASQPWPASLPVTPGGRYRVTTGSGAGIEIRTQLVTEPVADTTDIASALIRQKCDAQLKLLVDTVERSTAAAAGS